MRQHCFASTLLANINIMILCINVFKYRDETSQSSAEPVFKCWLKQKFFSAGINNSFHKSQLENDGSRVPQSISH